MKNYTPKRVKENVELHRVYRMVDRSHRDKLDNVICFFCQQPICDVDDPSWLWKIDHHHLLGRDGPLLLDPKFIVPSHPACHMQDYHTIEDTDAMLKRPWFTRWLLAIKAGDATLYNKKLRHYERIYGIYPTHRGAPLALADAAR